MYQYFISGLTILMLLVCHTLAAQQIETYKSPITLQDNKYMFEDSILSANQLGYIFIYNDDLYREYQTAIDYTNRKAYTYVGLVALASTSVYYFNSIGEKQELEYIGVVVTSVAGGLVGLILIGVGLYKPKSKLNRVINKYNADNGTSLLINQREIPYVTIGSTNNEIGITYHF